MAGMSDGFRDQLDSGLTTLCRCWAVTRSDGVEYGFTDHDRELQFEGLVFKADSGLSALALAQGTGLAVDNTEAVGALSDAAVREEDIEAGRFDGAEIRSWLVNWTDPSVRWLQFRGAIGELRRSGGAFHAELRGLSGALNRPLGRVFQKPCTAVLGDRNCRFSMAVAGYSEERPVGTVQQAKVFSWSDLSGFEPGWFARGRLVVTSGAASGLWGAIKLDRAEANTRVIELWEPLRASIEPGDTVRLEAGCDKRFETCRLKFNNLVNFQGFPDIPGEDWVVAVPKASAANTGGSLR